MAQIVRPDFASMHLGRRRPNGPSGAPMLSDFVERITPTPRVQSSGYDRAVAAFTMKKNNVLGCCCISAVGNMVQVVGTIGGRERIMTDPETIAGYSRMGYRGTPATDKGCVEEEVLKVWATEGFVIGGEHDKINAYCTFDPQNTSDAILAIDEFGIGMVGARLPLRAQSQPGVWDLPNGPLVPELDDPATWGDHSMAFVRAEPDDIETNVVTMITWTCRQSVTWRWWRKYVEEAHAVDHPDWTRTGTLANVDRAAMRQAWTKIAA